MNNLFRSITLLLLMFILGSVSAQNQSLNVKGTVRDAMGDPIIGATILQQGSTYGTISNKDGEFSLSVPDKSVLEISFVGYQTKIVKVTAQKREFHIVLEDDMQVLADVVVVGYGVQKKSDLTSSISTIKSEQLSSTSITSLDQGIQGRAAGVAVLNTSGQPGAGTSIRIRGTSSINGNNEPLYVIDGVPVISDANTFSTGTLKNPALNPLTNINPNDIESIEILKDASATSIYGARGANGVVLVTTKQGKKGEKTHINYSGIVSWASPVVKRQYVNAYEHAILYNEAVHNENPNAVLPFTDEDIENYRNGTYPSTNWYDEAFKKSAFEQMHNLSISGGSEKTTYNASIGYTNQGGLTDEISYKRYNARMSLNSDINKYVSVGVNASGYRGIKEDGWMGYVTVAQGVSRSYPTDPVYAEDGSFNYSGKDNPVAIQDQSGFTRSTAQQLNATAYAQINILPELSVKGVFSLRHDYTNQEGFKKHFTYGNFDSGLREGYDEYYNHNRYTSQVLANYNKTFGKHSIAVLGGFESFEHIYKFTKASRKGGGNNELTESLNTLDASSQKNEDGGYEMSRLSYFGRVQYDFMNKYLFEANLRADASSRFPKDNRWGVFPAISAGWRISEEAFIKDNVSWISNLKLRLGWGKTGNEELDPDDIYPAIPTYAYEKYMFGNSLYSTAYESRYVNNNLQWATVTNYELGLEAGFLNNMFGFELSVYKKKTNDMLLYMPIQGVIGMGAPAQNAGSVENTGFDLNLLHNNRINKDWSYAVNLNIAYVKNEIIDMNGTEGANSKNDKLWYIEGNPIGSYYGYVANGYFNTDDELANYPKRTGKEQLGDIKYLDLNGDGKITADGDRQIIGKNFPSWTTGLNLTLYYKDFDFSAMFQGAFDVDGYYMAEAAYAFYNGANALKRHLDRWTPEHHNASYPRITKDSQTNFTTSSFWLQNASYVRLKTISLGYNLPNSFLSKLGVQKAKLYVAGENLLTFSDLEGIDPEEGNERGWSYGNVKKVSIGLKVSF